MLPAKLTAVFLVVVAATGAAGAADPPRIEFGDRQFPIQPRADLIPDADASVAVPAPGAFFVTPNPGHVGPRRAPTAAELTSTLNIVCLPGVDSDRFIGFHPSKPMTNPRVKITPRGGAPEGIDIACLRVRYWPQRPHWASTTANVIPEIIEPLKTQESGAETALAFPATSYDLDKLRWVSGTTCAVPAGKNVLLLFRVSAPPGTPSGCCEYEVRLTCEEHPEGIPLSLAVRVLPGGIREVDQPDRTLFTKGCTHEELEILARDTGLNSLLWMGWPGVTVSKTPEGVRVDNVGCESLSNTARSMASLGMDGPLIVSWPGLALVVGKQLGYGEGELELLSREDVRQAFTLTLAALHERLKEDGYGDVWFFPNDEPGLSERKRELVLQQCRCARAAGLPTFLTSYFSDFNQGPGRELFTTVIQHPVSPEDARKKRAEAIARNGHWMLLTGVYSDGVVAPNRRSGLKLLRTDADGVAFWVWRSIKEDAWNDFDANAGVEPKDAILAYPPLPGMSWDGPFVETLQYEGMRLAYQDYCVFKALEHAVSQADKTRPALEEAQAFLDALKDDYTLGATAGELEQLHDKALLLLERLRSSADPAGRPAADSAAKLSKLAGDVSVSDAASVALEPLPELTVPAVIDGRLDPSEWDGAQEYPLVNNFTGEGTGAHAVMVANRPEGFTVAFDCHESEYAEARAIAAEHPKVPWSNTSVEVFLDVDGNRTGYAQVIVDATANVWTGYFSTGEVSFEHPLEGIQAAVASEGERMRVELLVPWAALADSSRLDTWTANFYLTRHVGATREESSFAWKKNRNFMRYHDTGSFGALCTRKGALGIDRLSSASGLQNAAYSAFCHAGSPNLSGATITDAAGEVLRHEMKRSNTGAVELTWTAPRQPDQDRPVFTLTLADGNTLRLSMPATPALTFLDEAPSVLFPGEPCLWAVRGHPGITSLRLRLGIGQRAMSRTFPLSPGRHLLSATCGAPRGPALDWELAWLDAKGSAVATERGVLTAP